MKLIIKITLKLVPVFIALLFTNCHKEEILPRDYPRINTLEVTDINTTGATLRAEFIYPGSSEISDHGFIWDINEDITLQNAEKVSLGSTSGKGQFDATLINCLNCNTVYYVKAYAVTEKYTVYGKLVKFKSSECLPPEIYEVIPNHGFDGDTIKITGTNFSNLSSNIKILFGVDQAEIIKAGINEIIFLVPFGYTNPGYVSAHIWINDFQLEFKNFLLDTVKIETIYPQVAKIPNTDIEITFNTTIRDIQKLSLDKFNISTFENIDNKISFRVPANSPVGYVTINVLINNKSVASKDSLLLISPWVKKSSCPLDESMDLTQQGFVINNKGYFYAYPYLTFSGRPGEIWEYDPLYDSWNFCCTFPDDRFHPFAFAINEKGYIGGGWIICTDQELFYVYEFTPENRSWNRVQNFPPIAIDYPIGFSIEEDGYVFGGGDIFEYSQPLDNWSMIGTYEKIPIYGDITGFEIDGKIYLKGFSNEIWYYNPSLNSWSKISDFPSKQRGSAIGFSINGNGYTGLGRNASYIDPELKDLWKYNPDNATWEEFANFPSAEKHRGNATALVISGKAYIGYDHELWEFNPDF